MKKLHFEAGIRQRRELEALAYWIADTEYIKERHGINEPELQTARKTLDLIFDQLDRLKVPFWVQNTVIVFAENWRQYKDQYLSTYLKTKNIII